MTAIRRLVSDLKMIGTALETNEYPYHDGDRRAYQTNV